MYTVQLVRTPPASHIHIIPQVESPNLLRRTAAAEVVVGLVCVHIGAASSSSSSSDDPKANYEYSPVTHEYDAPVPGILTRRRVL